MVMITPGGFSPKTPVDSLPYVFNFSEWLTTDSITGLADTIVSGVISCKPDDGTMQVGPTSVSGTLASAMITGGTATIPYTITCVITTASGMVAQADETLLVNASVR